MAEPIPLRKDLQVTVDMEREMLDWCATQLREFREGSGCTANKIALVLLGDDGSDQYSSTSSWSPGGGSRVEVCSVAAALFMRRAVDI